MKDMLAKQIYGVKLYRPNFFGARVRHFTQQVSKQRRQALISFHGLEGPGSNKDNPEMKITYGSPRYL
jgi:hypothetical protein